MNTWWNIKECSCSLQCSNLGSTIFVLFLEVINNAVDGYVLRVKRHYSFKLEEIYLILSCNSFPKSWGCPWSLVCQVFHHVVLWKPTAEVDQAQKANRGTEVPWRNIHPPIPLQRAMNHLSFPARSTLFTLIFQTPFLTDSYFYINLKQQLPKIRRCALKHSIFCQ